jgi:hypothetical protein
MFELKFPLFLLLRRKVGPACKEPFGLLHLKIVVSGFSSAGKLEIVDAFICNLIILVYVININYFVLILNSTQEYLKTTCSLLLKALRSLL